MSERRERIVEAIVSDVSLADLTYCVKYHLPPGYMPIGTDMREIASELVDKCRRNGLLRELLFGLKEINTENEEFQQTLDYALGVDPAMPGDQPFWYSEPMPLNQPLVDREELRMSLFSFLERKEESRRVLRVCGSNPGKTHCRWLIRHVAEDAGFEMPIEIDLAENVRSISGLANFLVDCLPLPYASYKERFSTEIREGTEFINWLAGQSRTFGKDRRWLVVFDHLGRPGVPNDLLNVIMDFAKQVSHRRFLNVWVMLIDCPNTKVKSGVGVLDPSLTFLEEASRTITDDVHPIEKYQIDKLLSWIVEVRREAADPAPGVPRRIRDAVDRAFFPLDRALLEQLSRDIADWWIEPPHLLAERRAS